MIRRHHWAHVDACTAAGLCGRSPAKAGSRCPYRTKKESVVPVVAADPRRMNRPLGGSLSERRTGLLSERRNHDAYLRRPYASNTLAASPRMDDSAAQRFGRGTASTRAKYSARRETFPDRDVRAVECLTWVNTRGPDMVKDGVSARTNSRILRRHGIHVAGWAAMTPMAGRDKSPFTCHRIVRDSEFTLNGRSYVICAPVLDTKRLVCECDCATCRRWEGLDSLAERPDVKASCFNCRWIVGGSEFCLDTRMYATCARVCPTQRLVSACDCADCGDGSWTTPPDDAPRPEQPNQRCVGDTPDGPV